MNGNFYPNSSFPGSNLNGSPNQQSVPSYEQNVASQEQSYIENILRLNKGKVGKFYITVPGSEDFQDKIFNGVIEQAGRDHLIVSNPSNGEWYLILMIYLDYVVFEEPISFIKDFN